MFETTIPAHVPESIVRDWPQGRVHAANWKDPFAETKQIFTDEYPSIFYSLGPFGGSWMVTRYEDIKTVYQTPEHFSSVGIGGFQKIAGEEWEMLPLASDGNDHRNYRSLLNPHLAPHQIDLMEDSIRARANELIDNFIDKGECEFVAEFARPYPIYIFMKLMGFPWSMYEKFLEWEHHILNGEGLTLEERAVGIRECIEWLRSFIAEREAAPQDDLTSKIVTAEIDGQPLSADEKIGMVFMLFVGGLDTIAGSLSLWLPWLFNNPDHRKQLIDNPEIIPTAVEELLRVNPLVNSPRYVQEDMVFQGVEMKKGDQVTCMNTAGAFDESQFGCPRDVKFDRQPNRHMTLAFGPHRCLGSHLARRELTVALETWLERIPDYRVKEGADIKAIGGLGGIGELPLEWDT